MIYNVEIKKNQRQWVGFLYDVKLRKHLQCWQRERRMRRQVINTNVRRIIPFIMQHEHRCSIAMWSTWLIVMDANVIMP